LIRHQARLDIQSEVGRGSVVSAWFPPSRRIPSVGEREAA